MKRVLSSIGIGGATVDTVFPRLEFTPGEVVDADVELSGGETTQEIERIYFALKARHPGADDAERAISEFAVDRAVTLAPEDELTLPAEIAFPYWVPLTRGEVSVWLETGLEIDWARDPTDEDALEIDLVDEVADPRDLDFDEQEIPITFESADRATMRRRIASEIDQHV